MCVTPASIKLCRICTNVHYVIVDVIMSKVILVQCNWLIILCDVHV